MQRRTYSHVQGLTIRQDRCHHETLEALDQKIPEDQTKPKNHADLEEPDELEELEVLTDQEDP